MRLKPEPQQSAAKHHSQRSKAFLLPRVPFCSTVTLLWNISKNLTFCLEYLRPQMLWVHGTQIAILDGGLHPDFFHM